MRHLLLLMLLPLAWALSPVEVSIEATMTVDQPVAFTELYVFSPDLDQNLSQIASQIGFRYGLWKAQVEGLSVHGCSEELAREVSIVLKDVNGYPALLLTYLCPPPRKVGEDVFTATYRYDRFSFPVMGGFMVLPQGYQLSVKLPYRAELVEATPTPTEAGDSVLWVGPLSTATRFSVTYKVPKVYTVPSVSKEISNFIIDPRVLFTLVALGVILYAAKDKLKEKIVQWVSSVSDIEKD
ncbi:MAG: hypothetical protein GXO00_00435 [Candidatus Diapherotrites archaeon]|nr:hypothetical protein [Candidatus Diapherotrites archaeon]